MKVSQRSFAASSRSSTSTLERLFANLFFFFFCAQILSPKLGGFSFYLEMPLSVINVFYLKWLSGVRVNRQVAACAALFFGVIFVFSSEALFRIISLGNSILFLVYAYERRVFYFMRYIIIAIFVGFAQFGLAQIDIRLARLIGPENISTVLWGANGMGGNTNLHAILWFERVSGLSREAGFFASLLCSAALLLFIDSKARSRSRILLLSLGLVSSLSKITLSLIPTFIIYRYRQAINKIPPEVILPSVVIVLVTIVSYLVESGKGLAGETFVHRFVAYYRIVRLPLSEVMLGVDNIRVMGWSELDGLREHFTSLAGFGGFILNYGLVLVIAWFILLRTLGATSATFLIIFVGTANVNPLTNQNFVVVYYFIGLYLITYAQRRHHLSRWTPQIVKQKFIG